MQTQTREKRYLKAINDSGLCEDLLKKLRILAGDLGGVSVRSRRKGIQPPCIPLSKEDADGVARIEEQWMIEEMQRTAGHM